MAVKLETCENCGQSIGKLETPFVWQDQTVCVTCYEKLKRTSAATSAPPPVSAPPPILQAEPIQVMPTVAVAQRPLPGVQTIEKTGKQWKLQILLGFLLVVAGFVTSCAGCSAMVERNEYGEGVLGLGFLMVVGGVAWMIVARMMAWWYHG